MKKIINLIALSIILTSCSIEDADLIAKNKVGKLTNKTLIEELDVIFKKDSIVKLPENFDVYREYKIYNEEGNHLLTIKPKLENDSIKTFESVQIYSDIYETERGISTASLYTDVMENYTINKVVPTLSSAILFIDEMNFTIALAKEDLGIDEFDMREISKDQIPDNVEINYITVWFD